MNNGHVIVTNSNTNVCERSQTIQPERKRQRVKHGSRKPTVIDIARFEHGKQHALCGEVWTPTIDEQFSDITLFWGSKAVECRVCHQIARRAFPDYEQWCHERGYTPLT